MSNDGSGYRPSAGEQRAQAFAAKKLGEALNGHGAIVPVDWDRLGRLADHGIGGGDSNRVADSVEPVPVEAIRALLAGIEMAYGTSENSWQTVSAWLDKLEVRG